MELSCTVNNFAIVNKFLPATPRSDTL
ncbi:MAG: hypothetical protein JWR15_3622, partial [Prosthecobacter sp.]|nr:hypothetical protein [Prosthecobacter sp.]